MLAVFETKLIACVIITCSVQAAKINLSDLTNHIVSGYHQSSFTWPLADADKRWRLCCLKVYLVNTAYSGLVTAVGGTQKNQPLDACM